MKRIFSIVTTMILAFSLVLSLGACAEIDNGSKIRRVAFELEFYNEDGEVEKTATVTAKLYTSFAPKTTEHVINLIEDGKYNGLCISNVTTTYAQFGDYKFGPDKLEAVNADKTVAGEFYNNGWTGNRLTAGEGALVLKRDTGFDSGKATIAVCFSSSADFDEDDYCVFGKLLTDDADNNADSSSMESLSSVERFKKIAELVSSSNGRKIYYVTKDEANDNNLQGKYITVEKVEEDTEYFDGYYTSDQIDENNKKLTEDEIKAFTDRLDSTDGTFEYITLPVCKVIVKSAYIVK